MPVEDAGDPAVGEQHAPQAARERLRERLDVRRAVDDPRASRASADPDRLEQARGPAGEDGDRARALVGDARLLEHLAHRVDVGAQRHPLVVREVPFVILHAVLRVVHHRGDRARPCGRRRELGWIEVQVDGEHPAALGCELGKLPQAAACEGVGHAEKLPRPSACDSVLDAERPAHERVDAAEVRVGPGAEVRRRRPRVAVGRGGEALGPEAELAGVEVDAPVGERIGDPRRPVAGRPAGGDRVVDRARGVEVEERRAPAPARPTGGREAAPPRSRSPWP